MEFALLILLIINLVILGFIALKITKRQDQSIVKQIEETIQIEQKRDRETISQLLEVYVQSQNSSFNNLQQTLNSNQNLLYKTVKDNLDNISTNIGKSSVNTNESLEKVRQTLEERLEKIQNTNVKKLDEMRQTVDEKLQKTLEDRIAKSFANVSENLEKVYKGLGEMQTLATGVGDLKKVLSNVKTRGILGEFQLGAILEEILSPEQYDTNIPMKKGSRERVEFAVKLPADDDKFIYLPIDSKFPGDTYSNLIDAYDSGDSASILTCGKQLENVLKQEAKDIHDKYVCPPETTDFAIMFLPFEGLYAEAVKRGMVEVLQREYKVNIAGPTTMAALLNSLQMGFKTLAIQKRSTEVWDVLSAVKVEFSKFDKLLGETLRDMDKVQDKLNNLIGVRTRQIQRKLKKVSSLEQPESAVEILELEADNSLDSEL
ncbi:DNA recombination protein RmuC [Actinomyces sp. zg-332]|uniref:DNA recombination protein RmuC n=1 Tax=Actinomyces sp. zg-332 TaxID=2708340 RepID=UPI00142200CF|nr:DNA recombination protein RmuC [Actinomyces sp. zg-332]QPK94393.1 DNA recombination protein RmuC [Actinomyces sp. zg-332]